MKAVYLIGAGPLAARVPAWAREAGLAVIAADGNPEAPGLARADERLVADGTDVEAHLAFVRSLASRYEIAGVVCGGEFGLGTVQRLQQALDLPTNPAEAVERALDKAATKDVWRAAGIPTPAGRVVREAGEVEALRSGGAVVLKPTEGSGSRAVRVVGAEASAAECAAEFELVRGAGLGEVVAEVFAVGRSIDANGCFLDGVYHPCGILEKVATPAPERLPIGGFDPPPLPAGEAEEVHALVERGARELGLVHGPVKADLIRTDDGYLLLEVAPRFHGDVTTANTLPFGSGQHPMRLLFRWFAEGRIDPSTTGLASADARHATWRVLCLPPGRVGRWATPPALDDADAPGGLTRVWHNPRVADRIPRYGDTAAIPGYVCAHGADQAEAEAHLRAWFASADYDVEPDPAHAAWYAALGAHLDAVGFDPASCGWRG